MKKYAKPVIKLLEIKKNYTLLKEDRGFYYKENDAEDDCIDTLVTLLTDHGVGAEWLLRELLEPQSKGIIGSLTDISLYGDRVVLRPSTTVEKNPEDYEIEIERDELIILVLEWRILVAKKAPAIFIYGQENSYFAADSLPQGIE